MDRDRELLASELEAFGYSRTAARAATNPITSAATPTNAALRAIARAREEALEEAAKVAETAEVPVAGEYNQSVAKIAAGYIATAIRSLKGGSTT